MAKITSVSAAKLVTRGKSFRKVSFSLLAFGLTGAAFVARANTSGFVGRGILQVGNQGTATAQISLRCVSASRISVSPASKSRPPLVVFPNSAPDIRRALFVWGGPDGMHKLVPDLLADRSGAEKPRRLIWRRAGRWERPVE